MRIRVLVVAAAVAILALGLFGVVPKSVSAQTGNSDEKCSQNACETVYTAARGSDFVYVVKVWAAPAWGVHTYRVLFDGYPRYSQQGDGLTTFQIHYTVDRGMCIQGGVEGVPLARTPCWNAP
ncbi:MAG: hypothetical protein WAM30_01360 [Candidatus Dormiibacterota bacterium]